MASRDLWKPKQQKIKHCAWREHKGMLGMMIQLDGSPHDWFEGEVSSRPKSEQIANRLVCLPQKPSVNSQRSVGGLPPLQSRVKPALPAVEAVKQIGTFRIALTQKDTSA